MTKVKICGITNLKDAQAAVSAGASALGFIFYKKSPRYVSPQLVKKIISQLPPFVTAAGVFVNEKETAIKNICKMTGICTIQFHGDENSEFCRKFKNFKTIKAFRVKLEINIKQVNEYLVDAVLFDTYQDNQFGGSGKSFDWKLIKKHKILKPVILSGGLNAHNILSAMKMIGPYAVDVSSGVEKSPGVKDHKLIKSLINLVNRV